MEKQLAKRKPLNDSETRTGGFTSVSRQKLAIFFAVLLTVVMVVFTLAACNPPNPIETANSYEITFHANGGEGVNETVMVKYNEPMPLITGAAPIRTGYAFRGYFDSMSGGKKYYNADLSAVDGAIWEKEANTILYAQWTVKVYTVKLHSGYGEDSVTDDICIYGTKNSLDVPIRIPCMPYG